MNMRLTFSFSLLALALCASTAFALPSSGTRTATDDDATITVTTFNQAINGDARSHCIVRIVVRTAEVDFTEGDTVVVRVVEDDNIFNDTIFQTDFEVTRDEINNGVDRTFDCSANFGIDGIGNLEVTQRCVSPPAADHERRDH